MARSGLLYQQYSMTLSYKGVEYGCNEVHLSSCLKELQNKIKELQNKILSAVCRLSGVRRLCIAGTASVEDKLDADGRSVWIGNVCFFVLLEQLYVMIVAGHVVKTVKSFHKL